MKTLADMHHLSQKLRKRDLAMEALFFLSPNQRPKVNEEEK
ncbi:MAG: hypothetical protein CM1200mP16_16490 [Nitrospina sp.]|nr:MAG: hypothetical protein CM1200mP16_16490 [Nitrospina sp.]